jgi:hypothetical protein
MYYLLNEIIKLEVDYDTVNALLRAIDSKVARYGVYRNYIGEKNIYEWIRS